MVTSSAPACPCALVHIPNTNIHFHRQDSGHWVAQDDLLGKTYCIASYPEPGETAYQLTSEGTYMGKLLIETHLHPCALLKWVYIHPKFRGHKYSRFLWEVVRVELVAQRFTTIKLLTEALWETKDRLIALYTGWGFQGTGPGRFYYKDEQPLYELPMGMQLTDQTECTD
eukprot:NODE_6145_length_567_cov_22.959091_g5980_i0.p1 GENE.NODE_6145_length_567_cov_22.959091_g5980_i0~~NODE_6145_length_567_cov_22.959091_g5980_i0.p1  ORF type:complete len:178 (+),score=27.21 NODE_6145_length_567_cov_22.959091_g5980_i0:26-535(+)